VSKPETLYYTAVHKLLPRTIHREKMANPYRGGTADVWYSGNLDDLWVEYKWLAPLPKKALVHPAELMSPLQQRWHEGRHKEGRNVVVILGTLDGAWVFEGTSWDTPLHPDVIRTQGFSKQMIADYIKKRTLIDVLVNPPDPDNSSDISVRASDDDDD
jgi:hypothetical protein